MHKDKAEGSQGRDEVERLKDATFIRKTDLEAKILEQQLTPSFRRLETLKTLTGASGLIIALVTVIGGFLSVGNWFIGQQKDRQIRSEERLDRALTMLAEKDASRRLAAVTSLGSFLRERNDTQAPVRNAII